MSQEKFKYYYITPTKLIKQALDIAEQLFCHPRYIPTCLNPCIHYHPPRTPKEDYITKDHNIEPGTREIPIHPPMPPHPPQPKPLLNIKNNPIRYPIHSILDHKKININIRSPKNTRPSCINGIFPTTQYTTNGCFKENYFH